MSTVPTVAVSATAEPFMPAKNMLETTLTCANPPRMRPTMARESSRMRCVTTELFISSPVRMKNGIATSGSFATASNI
jgi:hypothetical protein